MNNFNIDLRQFVTKKQKYSFNSMKIRLPENKSEITLGQYQRYVKLLERDLDVYSFNVIKKSGINLIEEIDNEEPTACLMIPDEVNNKFKQNIKII